MPTYKTSALKKEPQVVDKWMERPGAPQKSSEGFPIVAWQAFVEREDLGLGHVLEVSSAKDRKDQAQARYWEVKASAEEGRLVLKSEVIEVWTQRMGKAIALLRARFENELPPVCEGLSAAEIRLENRQAVDSVLDSLHNDYE